MLGSKHARLQLRLQRRQLDAHVPLLAGQRPLSGLRLGFQVLVLKRQHLRAPIRDKEYSCQMLSVICYTR